MKEITLTQEEVHKGPLILVNPRHQTAWNMPKELSTVGPGVQLQREAATLLGELMQQIGGWKSIAPVSGWRSLEEQQNIWNSSLLENGPEYTRTYVALPGHSEHQTGLAIDL